MALVYVDASAVVRLCVGDRGSDLITALWERADMVITSRVLDAQVPAAFAQARRGALASLGVLAQAEERWQTVRRGLYIVETSAEQGERAGELAARHELRADDAWHLAAALTVRTAGAVLASWDERLIAAGRSEGLLVLPW